MQLGPAALQLLERGLGVGKRGFALGDGAFQRGDLRAQRVGVQQREVVQVLLLGRALGDEGVALGGDLTALVAQRIAVSGGFRLGQLLLQLGQLLLELGQPLRGEHDRLALGGVQVDQIIHRGDGVGQLLALGDEIGALLVELLDGGVELFSPLVEGGEGVVDLPVDLALGAGELALAVGELGLGVVQLALGVGELCVHVLQDGAVEHVDAAGLDGDVHALLDDAGGGGRGHAVQRLKGGHQLVLHIFGEGQDVHVVPGDGEYGDGQHVRVQLHRHRRADGVVPLAPKLVQAGGQLDQRRVHVCAVVELHDDHGHVVPRGGRDLLDVRQRGDGGLHGPGDVGLHLLRSRANIRGVYHHVGKVHAGQQIGGHLLEGDDPEHDDQYDAHDDRVGLFDAVSG